VYRPGPGREVVAVLSTTTRSPWIKRDRDGFIGYRLVHHTPEISVVALHVHGTIGERPDPDDAHHPAVPDSVADMHVGRAGEKTLHTPRAEVPGERRDRVVSVINVVADGVHVGERLGRVVEDVDMPAVVVGPQSACGRTPPGPAAELAETEASTPGDAVAAWASPGVSTAVATPRDATASAARLIMILAPSRWRHSCVAPLSG
jgi:hypothetical protein